MPPDDKRMLQALIDAIPGIIEQSENDEEPKWAGPVRDMLAKNKALTTKQTEFVHDVFERIVGEPIYKNEWSSGKIPRGEKLATPVPDVLKKPLPLKPPQRRRED